MKSLSFDITELSHVARNFLAEYSDQRIFAFNGEMGAGKTTFILALLKEMGISDPEGSPTYSLINTYYSDKYGNIYHFDAYRLKNQFEALDSGMEEYIDSGAYCFIEWPDKIEALLPEDTVHVEIKKLESGKRTIRTFEEG